MIDANEYFDQIRRYLNGETVYNKVGRPWPKNERTRVAARAMLRRAVQGEYPQPLSIVVDPPKVVEDTL